MSVKAKEWKSTLLPELHREFPSLREGTVFAIWAYRKDPRAKGEELLAAANSIGVEFAPRDLVFAKRFLGLRVTREERRSALLACASTPDKSADGPGVIFVEFKEGELREVDGALEEESVLLPDVPAGLMGAWTAEMESASEPSPLMKRLEGKGEIVEVVSLDGCRRQVFVFGFDSDSKNVLRTKEERRKAQLREEVVDLSLEGAARVLGSSSDDEEEARIDRDPAAATDVDPGVAFASAVKHAREAVQVVAARLQERLDHARRSMPVGEAEREALAREVNEAIGMGVQIEIDGIHASSLTLHKGSLTWRMGHSKVAGFRKYPASTSSVHSPEPAGEHLER